MDRVASNQMGPGPGATRGPVVGDHRTAGSVLAALGLAVLVVDADQNLVAANPEGVALLGGNLEVVLGRPLLGLMAPVDAEACLESALAVVLAGGDRSLELEAVLPGGRRVWLDLALRPVPGPDGAVGGAVISARDVSLPRARERALRESETRFRALIQRAKDVSVILDREATVIYASPGAVLLTGSSPADLVGLDGWSLVHPDDHGRLAVDLESILADPGAHTTAEYRVRVADGGWRWVESTITNMIDDPAVSGVVTNLRDITDRKRAEADLRHRVLHDQLTGLPNRTHLDEALAQALGETSGAAVLIFDIDQFKLVNDSYGHDTGDALLTQVAARLRHALRPGDMAGRFGGDEFVVVCRDVNDAAHAEVIADRLQHSLRSPFELAGVGAGPVHVTASVGIAAGERGTSASELFQQADAAMYVAKRSGRARHAVYDEAMRARAGDRLRLELDLRHALDRGDLEVHYQPIVGLESGRITSAEALARWRHPTRGDVDAGTFIAVAEESGLVVELGDQIIRATVDQLSRWHRDGHDVVVAVNLSAHQIGHPGLLESITAHLDEFGVSPTRFAVEITETAVMADPDRCLRVVEGLVGLGIQVALDDFGTGYSSLAYLKALPVTAVKVDQGFVNGVDSRPDDYEIVAAVASLARSFGRLVIAEGVETESQRRVLRELGCHLGQGLLWSAPVDAAAFGELLGDAESRSLA